MGSYTYLRVDFIGARYLLAVFFTLLVSYSAQSTGSSVAPCTAENYIAPSSQAEIMQLKNNLAADAKLAFQSGNTELFYGLLCRAAAANLVDAELRLGAIHMMNWGFIKQNYFYARYWLERASAKGHLKSSYLLGTLYIQGKGGPVYGLRAVALFEKAAEAGDAEAMIELVGQYTEGLHVLQSINKAKYWALRAKQAGHPTGGKMLELLENAPPSMRR